MAEEREIRTPLLQNSSSSTPEIQRDIEEEIVFSIPHQERNSVLASSPSIPLQKQRLVSLDVFRGLTIAVCIFNFVGISPFYFVFDCM